MAAADTFTPAAELWPLSENLDFSIIKEKL